MRPKPLPTRALREGLLDPVHEALGDRRAAVGDPAHAADVELGEARVAQHRVVDRGHRHELVDAVLADRLEEAVEVERAGEDLDPAAELEQRDQLAVAAGDVEQRHGHQRRDRRVPPRGRSKRQRNAFSLLVRKFPCEVIAPFGKPVVPLV